MALCKGPVWQLRTLTPETVGVLALMKLYMSLSWRRQWHPTPVLLPWKSHGRRSLVGCSPWGREESGTTEWFQFHVSLWCTGEGNGNPLQYSFLENPRDRVAWWAAIYGVTQSQTWLKRLSMHACFGGGNGNPLQYSFLENPRDRGAWWAAVYRVAQSRTRPKWLSSSSSSIPVIVS